MIVTVGSILFDDKNNKYHLTEVIGMGGFGMVYKAFREHDGKEFAVKTLLQAFSSDEYFSSFKNELVMTRMIKGNNIIDYEYIHDGESFNNLPPYIIMEYADGGTLAEELSKRKKAKEPYTKEKLYEIFLELVNGMKIINDKMIHRDIKPENILISNGKLKITDFGLAKMVNDATRSNTLKGYGTCKYMAPEGWTFDKNTMQMDIYSMGILFFELATLEYPYSIKSNDMDEYKKAHLYSGVSNYQLLEERTSPEISSMILSMIEKPTQRRFSSWDEILQHVNSFTNEKNDLLDQLVNTAITQKNEREIKRQQQIEEERAKQQKIENFCMVVKSQFESDIYPILNDFVEKYNKAQSTVDKCRFTKCRDFNNGHDMVYKLELPGVSNLEINYHIVLENSLRCEYTNLFTGEDMVKFDTPRLNKRDVMCFIEITNYHYGFNLVLLKSDGLYGDWFIIDNKNNLIYLCGNSDKYKNEPFSFKYYEIKDLIMSSESTHLYSSNLVSFSKKEFINRLLVLIGK